MTLDTAPTHPSHSGWKILSTDIVDCGSVIRIGIVLEDSKGRKWETEHETFKFDLTQVKDDGNG